MDVSVLDGVAAVTRGDLVIVVYQKAAELHRARFVFNILDALAPKCENGIVVLLIVLPTAAAPDAATRAENAARARKLGSRLRRVVTCPIGDGIHIAVVRAVMRALGVLHGGSRTHHIASSLPDAVRLITDVAERATPTRAQIFGDINAAYQALGVVPQ